MPSAAKVAAVSAPVDLGRVLEYEELVLGHFQQSDQGSADQSADEDVALHDKCLDILRQSGGQCLLQTMASKRCSVVNPLRW